MNTMNKTHKIRWPALIICLLIPLAVSGLSGILTAGSMDTFEALVKPPLTPPGIVFPIVWTILFFLMGVSSYRIFVSGASRKTAALTVYGIQLVVNFLWSIFFFNLHLYLFSFFWLVFLWLLILLMLVLFFSIDKVAGWLQVPYFVWVTFAGYLNLCIYFLNR